MGCGGICNRFNDGICMGACSMDDVGRDNYVKVLESREAKKKALESNNNAGGVVLKPINPAAHAFLNGDKPKPKREESKVTIKPLKDGEMNEFLKMKL